MRTAEKVLIDFEDAPGRVIKIYTGEEDIRLRENNSIGAARISWESA
jgi:hypothetical protein